jgi:glycine hydroxymethyltransferase
LLIDLKNKGVSGAKVEYLCEQVNISLNKNSVFGDTSAANPSGIRIGTAALTTRQFKEADFVKVGEFIDSVVCLTQSIQEKSGRKLVDFKKYIAENDHIQENIWSLAEEVRLFASEFPFIEFE